MEEKLSECVRNLNSASTTCISDVISVLMGRGMVPSGECMSTDCVTCREKYFNLFADKLAEVEARAEATKGTYLRLPVDENGKPWKEGDRFLGEDGYERTVEAILFQSDVWHLVGYDGIWRRAELCTRLYAPVLDADGVDIKVGDEGWVHLTGAPVKVKDVHFDTASPMAEDKPWIDLEDGSWMYAAAFTHKEPDSWSKLAQFAVDHAAYADGCSDRDAFLEIADRIKALRERDA